MDDSVYSGFEDIHRGSTETISKRLMVYEPLITQFSKTLSSPIAIDLGCGRGEFLKMINEIGFKSLGVDNNREFVKFAKDQGLSVEKSEVLEFLKKQESESYDLVTAFHLIEHIDAKNFLNFINETDRILKPGGLIILETPNPENVIVGSCNFYVDITHTRPVPSKLIRFIFENLNYKKNNIWGLNSVEKNSNNNPVSVIDIFGGVSPDYAFIALKDGEKRPVEELVNELKKKRGVTLNEIAGKYEQRISVDQKDLLNEIRENQDWIKREFYKNLEKLHVEIQGMNSDIQQEIKCIHEQTHFYQTELNKVTNSRSWRLTSPLRFFGKKARALKYHLKRFFFDFTNLSPKTFFKIYSGKLSRKLISKFYGLPIKKIQSHNNLKSKNEKKLVLIMEKISKEK